jgi:hypothetical protein
MEVSSIRYRQSIWAVEAQAVRLIKAKKADIALALDPAECFGSTRDRVWNIQVVCRRNPLRKGRLSWRPLSFNQLAARSALHRGHLHCNLAIVADVGARAGHRRCRHLHVRNHRVWRVPIPGVVKRDPQDTDIRIISAIPPGLRRR